MKTNIFHLLSFLLCIFLIGCEKDYSYTASEEKIISYPGNAIPYAYKVSETKQVAFAKGNLYYENREKTWRFCPEQWSLCGTCFFEWGNTSTPYKDGLYVKDYKNLDDKSDWGKACAIEGCDANESWRCLSSDEWDYIIKHNNHSYGCISSGEVETYGLFICPPGMSIEHISMSEWENAEKKGVVFLPALGYMDETGERKKISGLDDEDRWDYDENLKDLAYWSASVVTDTTAFAFVCPGRKYISPCDCYMLRKNYKCPVRLVCDLN